ncbi:MAG: hypothetical protein HQK66_05100, partial [Desulfamplus sp.]|nr:hypothetical protein [Desulfamplus sp.]
IQKFRLLGNAYEIVGIDHYFGQQRRGEPVCSPFTRADTQVCPYKMAILAEKMIKPK